MLKYLNQIYEFAKHIYDNFAIIVVPPLGALVNKFLQVFRMVIEQGRIKMCEYQRTRLRDRAFVILT